MVYSTKVDGAGGRIRASKDQFFVSEVLRNKARDGISESGSYAVFRLKKTGIDTNHALSEIYKKYGIRLKALGLKDANATTEQFVCDTAVSRRYDNVDTNRYSLEKIGYVKKPLTKKDMVGNHFKIAIECADFAKVSAFDQYDKILNFYGYQRFGSKRPISHLVGKSIIMKDFEGAVKVLLSGTSEYDSPENNLIREELKDSTNYSKSLARIPPHMDIEKMVLEEMVQHGNSLKALHAIPLSLRRFFVEAYQSYIFNRTVSMAYEMGEDLSHPQPNDVCYDKDDNLGRYQNDPEQKLAVPIVGYSYSKKNRFDYQISKVLEEEETNPKDFFVKEMQEVSGEGGFRQSLIQCKDFSVAAPFVSFTLSRGSYATVMLREIIKPENPVAAGF
ncbi:MAG TPA: tRNA pseudouridine(13) synthase TruD [Candidatus Nitrosotalea sp.]|nr:tRNA pseudouridine(13) synthase TruD [Candidatus Nitrosotalea sp.]